MAQIYINKTITAPISRTQIGAKKPIVIADEGATASGAFRMDISNLQHEHQVALKKLRKADWVAIYDYLESIYYGETVYWDDTMTGTPDDNSVYVRITYDSVKEEFGDSQGWESDGRTVTLTIRETR